MAEHRTTKMFHENVTEEFQEDQIKGSLVNGEGVSMPFIDSKRVLGIVLGG